MHLRQLLPATAALAGLASASNVYASPLEQCMYSCQTSLDSVTFAGPHNTSEAAGCANSLYLQSTYLCAAKFCTPAEIAPGVALLERICKPLGFSVPSFESVVAAVSPAQLAAVPSVEPGQKTTDLNHTVVPDQTLYDMALLTNLGDSNMRTVNVRYSNALYIFWGVVVFLGICGNAFGILCRPVKGAGSTDTNRKNKSRNPLVALRSYIVLRPVFRHGPLTKTLGTLSPTVLELVTILAYAIVNVVLLATNYGYAFVPENTEYATSQQQLTQMVGRRFATLALTNLPILWLFSMRNNPLIYLTGWTFTTFSRFHRWVARIAALEALGHGIAFTVYECLVGGSKRYRAVYETLLWNMGLTAVVMFCFIVALANSWVRKWWYDIFLVAHILLSVVALVAVWYHLAVWNGLFNGYIWACVGIWAGERLFRFVRLLVALALGRYGRAPVHFDEAANMLRVDVSHMLAAKEPTPGTFYYVYAPIKPWFWQSHPFTLAVHGARQRADVDLDGEKTHSFVHVKDSSEAGGSSRASYSSDAPSNSYSFLINPQKGFTGALKKRAQKQGGTCSVPLILEGPYGLSPPIDRFGHVLLVIGGSGISVALSSIQKVLAGHSTARIHLVWTVRNVGMLRSVLDRELRAVVDEPRLQIDAYVTQKDAEIKGGESDEGLPIKAYRRADIYEVVDTTASAVGGMRTAVVTCGPQQMVDDTRLAVSRAINSGATSLELFVESFAW